MYIVASIWEALPGKEAEFEQKGEVMRGLLRNRPEVAMVEAYSTEEGNTMVIIGYKSKEAYESLINEPNGFFEQTAKEHKLEETARWVHSWRGETRGAAVSA